MAPPFPMTHPIKSFGMFISVVVVVTLAKAVAAVPGRRLLVAANVAKAGMHKEPKMIKINYETLDVHKIHF